MSANPPARWAADKAGKARRYAAPPLVDFIRAARDVAMPGVPLAALGGVACNGSVDENTTGWISGSARERAEALTKNRKPLGGDPRTGYGHVRSENLHELGPFGAEGGRCPADVATDADCAWVELAKGEVVTKILGRQGVTGARWHGAVEDQVAIGVANLARHARKVRAKLDPRLRWVEDGDGGPKTWTLWPFALACMSWSAGAGGASKHANAYAAELAALPEAQRWGAFCRHAGAVDDPGYKHRADEYSALRTCQKLAAARLAVSFTGEGAWALGWLDDGLGADREAVDAALVRAST